MLLNGGERAQPATVKRYSDRFARFNLDPAVLRPSYGMAEAVIYVATHAKGGPPKVGHFDSDKLPAGQAEECASGAGTPLVSYDVSKDQTLRIVDPDTRVERPERTVGEIWLHGRNVGIGYWQNPEASERTFRAQLVDPSPGTPEGPWLRTGDSGFVSDGELFIIGRIKDLLIVYGRNHSADDIEATIQQVNPGRCAAVAVSDKGDEKVVTLIEYRQRNGSDQDPVELMQTVKREVKSAISKAHGLKVTDVVLLSPGSLPITTSGKIRRAMCVELYRRNEFTRLDA
jgi:long-chain fatty acid adenylyltransferase FadD28